MRQMAAAQWEQEMGGREQGLGGGEEEEEEE
jgi:hypothetical protein